MAIGGDPVQKNHQMGRFAAGKRRDLRPVELHGYRSFPPPPALTLAQCPRRTSSHKKICISMEYVKIWQRPPGKILSET